jgi:hypothetical protein
MKSGIVGSLLVAFVLLQSSSAFAFQEWICTIKDSRGTLFSSYYDGIFEQSSKRVATSEAMDKCKAGSKTPATCTLVSCERPKKNP